MYNWMTTHNVAMECYFETHAKDGDHQLWPGGYPAPHSGNPAWDAQTPFPLAAAKYRDLFGISYSFGTTAAAIPGAVQAANYDTGGQGLAYNQIINGNQTGGRADNSSANFGTGIGWTYPGQWYKYTVNVAAAGTYSLACSVNDPNGGGTFHLEDKSGRNLSGTITCPTTGNWNTAGTATATVTLAAGPQVLKWVQDSSNFNLLSMIFTASGSGALITGTVFSDGAGAWGGTNSTADKAFDGDTNTFYDCANTTGYVGLDAGLATTVTRIVYAPRNGFESRMYGGVFEGSNTSATSGYTTLGAVTSTPTSGLTNTITVTNATPFRWLRYRDSQGGECNVAEIQFVDPPAGVPTVPTGVTAVAGAAGSKKVILSWAAASGATSYHVLRSQVSGSTGTQAVAVNVTGLTYTDTGLTAGTTYYYKVTAVNASGGTNPSVQVSAAAK